MIAVSHIDVYSFKRPMSGNSHMVWIVLGAVGSALIALFAALWAALRAIREYLGAIEPPESVGESKLVWDEFAKLRLSIAEGIDRVDRSERRIANTLKRARRRMEAAGYVDDGVEAEAAGLSDIDEGVEPVEGVPDLPETLERPGYSGPSAIRGVSEAELHIMRGGKGG